jgi:hypothetical protein
VGALKQVNCSQVTIDLTVQTMDLAASASSYFFAVLCENSEQR